MSKTASKIFIDGNSSNRPPWSGAQQDARLEALNFAFQELVTTLHESGQLSIPALLENLDSAAWLYADSSPDTLIAVRQIATDIDCMQQKIKPHVVAR